MRNVRSKYSSITCRNRAAKRRARAKSRGLKARNPEKRVIEVDFDRALRNSARRGERYVKFCETGLPEKIARSDLTQEEAAALFGSRREDVSRWMVAWREDLAIEQARAEWKPPPEAQAALDDFHAFRQRYFRVPDERGHVLRGLPYRTPEFQRRWIDAIIKTIDVSGELQILSPPRHGKSELLAHFCIWLILRNPNIRIMWVGGSEEIAKQSLDQVRQELESNERLIADFCGPGSFFRPTARSGLPWRGDRFTIGLRTVTGIKSPTMVAVGKGGKLLSRDADFIIVDDIVDHGSTQAQSSRDSDSKWLRTQLLSRREPHTALVVIGSRQHPQDIYKENLRKNWSHVVETAHDEAACNGEPHDERCVLFPELRPYEWLMKQRDEMGDLFEMVYLNRPRSESGAIFVAEQMHNCRNAFRGLGLAELGPVGRRLRLVAGLDPAASGYQAAFLWGVDTNPPDGGPRKRYMIDLRNDLGGGIQGMRQIVREWRDLYGLGLWIVERNSQQTVWLRDEQLLEYCAEHGVVAKPHHTGSNKWDEHMGVSALSPMFREGLIDLPYGNREAQQKTDLFIGQCLDWDGNPKPHWRRKSDLLMAAWFPSEQIRSWLTADEGEVDYQGFEPTEYPMEWFQMEVV